MKLITNRTLVSIIAGFSLAILSSCSEKSEDLAKVEPQASILETIILKEMPKEVTTISKIRESAKLGDKVTFKGDAIGSMNIFMENRAVMILGDPDKIKACNLIPGDGCETPWDVCCDDPDVIKASIITLRYLDASGNILKEGFKGVNNIKELTSLIVSGTVAKESTKENMIVNVSGLFVKVK